jgi:DNA polymerase I-like protein with 3'-5' exonuclease and polymerase domains
MRHLIKPPEGFGIAYIDWNSQELGIAAGRSGDERMIEGYLAGDPYMAFARDAGLAPPDATKATHPVLRERVKVVCLGVLYGMSAPTMAEQLGITRIEAADLMRRHRYTYPRFWRWSEAFVGEAAARKRAVSAFGWPVRITALTKTTQIFNFPMQANGAEAMRLAAIAATESGIEVCGPIHDAFLICAPINRLDEDIERMRAIMQLAGGGVAGIPIGTEAAVALWPGRFTDQKGAPMFRQIAGMAGEVMP